MSCEQPTKQNCSLRLSCKQLTLKSLIKGLHMIMVKFGPNSSTFVKSVSDICYLLVALWKIHCLYKIHVLYICLIFCAFTGRTWRQKWRWFCNLIKMRLNTCRYISNRERYRHNVLHRIQCIVKLHIIKYKLMKISLGQIHFFIKKNSNRLLSLSLHQCFLKLNPFYSNITKLSGHVYFINSHI